MFHFLSCATFYELFSLFEVLSVGTSEKQRRWQATSGVSSHAAYWLSPLTESLEQAKVMGNERVENKHHLLHDRGRQIKIFYKK